MKQFLISFVLASCLCACSERAVSGVYAYSCIANGQTSWVLQLNRDSTFIKFAPTLGDRSTEGIWRTKGDIVFTMPLNYRYGSRLSKIDHPNDSSVLAIPINYIIKRKKLYHSDFKSDCHFLERPDAIIDNITQDSIVRIKFISHEQYMKRFKKGK